MQCIWLSQTNQLFLRTLAAAMSGMLSLIADAQAEGSEDYHGMYCP